MNRPTAERRHHRERVIRKRVRLMDAIGWMNWHERPAGRFAKTNPIEHGSPAEPPRKGNGGYRVTGVTNFGWWDETFYFNTRQALKRELRQEVEECA